MISKKRYFFVEPNYNIIDTNKENEKNPSLYQKWMFYPLNSNSNLIGTGSYCRVYWRISLFNSDEIYIEKIYRNNVSTLTIYREIGIQRWIEWVFTQQQQLQKGVSIILPVPRICYLSPNIKHILYESTLCSLRTGVSLLRNPDLISSNPYQSKVDVKRLRPFLELSDTKRISIIYDMIIQMALRIYQLHSIGIYHFDIKPDNFVIQYHPMQNRLFVQCIDFNLSCFSELYLHRGKSSIQSTNGMFYHDGIGTFVYRPLECVLYQEEIDITSSEPSYPANSSFDYPIDQNDIHALGISWINIVTNIQTIICKTTDDMIMRDIRLFGFPFPNQKLSHKIIERISPDRLEQRKDELQHHIHSSILREYLSSQELDVFVSLLYQMCLSSSQGKRPSMKDIIVFIQESVLFNRLTTSTKNELNQLISWSPIIFPRWNIAKSIKHHSMWKTWNISHLFLQLMNICYHRYHTPPPVFHVTHSIFCRVLDSFQEVNETTLHTIMGISFELSCGLFDYLSDVYLEPKFMKRQGLHHIDSSIYSSMKQLILQEIHFHLYTYSFYQYVVDHIEKLSNLSTNEFRWFSCYLFFLYLTPFPNEKDYHELWISLKSLSIITSNDIQFDESPTIFDNLYHWIIQNSSTVEHSFAGQLIQMIYWIFENNQVKDYSVCFFEYIQDMTPILSKLETSSMKDSEFK